MSDGMKNPLDGIAGVCVPGLKVPERTRLWMVGEQYGYTVVTAANLREAFDAWYGHRGETAQQLEYIQRAWPSALDRMPNAMKTYADAATEPEVLYCSFDRFGADRWNELRARVPRSPRSRRSERKERT